ncbi:MAG: ferrochelatase [Holophagales bacterium]|nr:ferrochelatase [Holophagales bacterium]MYF05165.1 ferrochelatase [Holophagales bacterium]MYJ23980.1 ferrochelatase [Holophagales bacterium]
MLYPLEPTVRAEPTRCSFGNRDSCSLCSADRRAIGVLLANVGTPAAPTAPALRSYLREFLSDTRIAEQPRWKWLPILYLFVLTTRPQRVARLYAKIWTDEGSPLLAISRRQAEGIEARLEQERAEGEPPFHVAVGMRYGEPSIAAALDDLRRRGAERILFLPLFPQYAAATTASALDILHREARSWRRVPEIRTINSYYVDPGYIRALAASIRETWADGEPDRLVLSYHGVPKRYIDNGDPYQCQCLETTRLLVRELGIDEERVISSFQSQFGRELWIGPKTDALMRELPKAGLRNVDIACPGFSADCIETLEEIEVENRGYFEESGGERLRYIPCLNDRPDHLDALTDLILRNTREWRNG